MGVRNEFLGDVTKVMQCLVDRNTQTLLYELYGKISWNMRDFDYAFGQAEKRRSDVTYMIILCDWILESHDVIFDCYARYTTSFSYSHDLSWCEMREKFRALRSFIVAHPLCTDRHKAQGYDGSKLSIEIYPCNGQMPNAVAIARGVGEFNRVDDIDGTDFFISWYGMEEPGPHFEGHSYQFLYDFSHMTIDRVCALLSYLSKIRKKDLYKF